MIVHHLPTLYVGLITIVHLQYIHHAKSSSNDHDFYSLRLHSDEKFFIDKSLLIKEIVDSKEDGISILISRPPKFGKTVNLNMLERFFKIPDNKYEEQLNRNLFLGGNLQLRDANKTLLGLEIANHTDILDRYFGKHPVVSLSLKDCNFSDADQMAKSIGDKILKFTRERGYKVPINFTQPTNISHYNITDFEGDFTRYNFHIVKFGLEHLTKYMYETYWKKVYVLIDDYDYALYQAYRLHGPESQQFNHIYQLLENMVTVIIDDKYIEQLVITGVMPLGLDWNLVLKEYTILDKKFSTYFGFTDHEVDHLFAAFPSLELQKSDIKSYYKGYSIGGEIIYNTVSILQCLKHHGSIRTYLNSDEALKPLDDLPTESAAIAEIDHFLCKGRNRMETIKKKLFRYNFKTTQDTFTYLLYTGYMNAIPVKQIPSSNNSLQCECSIPTMEIKEILHNKIVDWISLKLKLNRTGHRNQLIEYLIDLKFQHFEEFAEHILRMATEQNLYSGSQYYLDMFETLVTDKLQHERFHYIDPTCKEERIGIIFVNNGTGIIIELQMVNGNDVTILTSKAAHGLKQIVKARYDLKLKKDPRIGQVVKLAMALGRQKVVLKYLVEKRDEMHPATFEWIDITDNYLPDE